MTTVNFHIFYGQEEAWGKCKKGTEKTDLQHTMAAFGGHLTADRKVRATRAPKFSEAATPEWAGEAQQAANHCKSLQITVRSW